jgi:alpha-galactosidase
MYVNESKDSAVMFSYITGNRYGNGTLSPIKLKGLHADKKYRIREINMYPDTRGGIRSTVAYSGDYLMTVGFNPGVNANRMSVILQITEAK